uniref:ABC transporter domain-containing protein n=1 Tax=Oryza nivara TaxID=4536 RepID=A0A0E0HJ07_ORYNI
MSSSSSHHPEFASCTANDDEHHLDEFELELVVQDVQRQQNNGSANTDQHERENLLLLDDSSKSGALKRRLFFDNLLKNGLVKLLGLETERAKINVLEDVSGIIKPCRLTLLLGPPGCGKSTLLRALSGKLDKSLKVTGDISYNGYQLDEFVPEKTAAYISQYDLHIPEMTVRETLDFSSRCQGVGRRPKILKEVSARESAAGIIPDADIDIYMKAISVEASKRSLQTDYILKILGLEICADTMVGDAMIRGLSGGQKKRLTTAEMIVGPARAYFMDEISNGLDSSTTFQIISCFQQLTNISEYTMVISLLQPTPEVFDLFDDLILMAEGKIIYHGPRNEALNFFEECGFICPERKEVADFLQEILSCKDQQQYWSGPNESYRYISPHELSSMFKENHRGRKLEEPIVSPKSELGKEALAFNKYSLQKLEMFKACGAREALLMKRSMFVYVFKTGQLAIIALVTMSVFLRTRMTTDFTHATYYMGALFFSILMIMLNGTPEISMQIRRLPSFYKQKSYYFYSSWAYAIPASVLKVPVSILDSLVWICITYYGIGYTASVSRFFCQFLMLCFVHQSVTSLYRFIASYFQTPTASFFYLFLALTFFLMFGGFTLPKPSMPGWLNWGFWISPMTYAEIGTVINEFQAPRWQKETIQNITIGNRILINHGLYYSWHFYWISIGALFGSIILFYIAFGLALDYITSIEEYHGSRPIKRLCQEQEKDSNIRKESDGHSNISRAKMTIPVMELPITFHNLNYYIDTPPEMLKQGYPTKRLQLLNNITGALRPGVLSALMGVSGAGKTTLLDVLAGRKTGGYIEGDIRIGGYPKVQETFVRILGYCEQADIHSPQLTVEESVTYSAWLRLPSHVDKKTRSEFVAEVLETVELDQIKDVLVGTPQKNGLSMEQRKRLTIAVELVSNPSVILMDEPTTGLDTRSAAIVIRAVKNICKTGRTVVCTIHQPSTEIFEAFDELILMKNGGKIIYNGPIGERSSKKISGVLKVKSNCNPAAWMMDVTSTSMEVQHNMDFAILYDESSQHRDIVELVEKLSIPIPNSEILSFSHRFPRNGWIQLKACLWKQNLTYWRSPEYNLRRIMLTVISALVYGVLFWKRAKILNDEQDLFNVFGAMYLGSTTIGSYNHQSIIPFSTTERIVMYREKFAGMYSSWSYSFAQAAIEIPYVFIQVQIPKWWVWLYYLTPTSWTLDALLTSQYGNIEKEIRAFGETKSVSIFLNDYFGFHKDKLSLVAAVLIAFPFVLIILFSFSIEKFNFQKR